MPNIRLRRQRVEAFYVELEKFYKEDHTYKVIVGDFNANIGPRRTTINWDLYTTLVGLSENAVMDNVDGEYDRFVHYLHDSAKRAESLRTTKRRLSPETLELIRQRGEARASGSYQRTPSMRRGRFEHPQCPPELRQLQDQDDRSPTFSTLPRGPRRRSSTISIPISSSVMSILRRIDASSPLFSVRDPARHIVGEGTYNTRSRQDHTRTPDKPPTSTHQHSGAATVGVQDSISMEDQQDRLAVQEAGQACTTYGNYRPICLVSVGYKAANLIHLEKDQRNAEGGAACEEWSSMRFA
ncbi:unnamed protein product [Heligmosomoides polygyrus]|uniref:Endo/exonuclease/phosphatase domain-containing protein n=1 Tax=Heligmosomoides polygyrus TaxID=6339 RepID=A0A183FEY2_HELPZ|nr:unnamed protein product [Heligmosomoides polygyrus]